MRLFHFIGFTCYHSFQHPGANPDTTENRLLFTDN
jgi:hypothetical protein